MTEPIRLFWWRHRDPRIRNVGDELSPLIVERVSGRRVEHAPLESCDLVAIGSLAEVALAADRASPARLWGTGFQLAGPSMDTTPAIIDALRGPVSAERVGRAGLLSLGDPGLLAHLVLDRPAQVMRRVGIVPHYVDLDLPIVVRWEESGSGAIISPLLPPSDFVRAIAGCEVVFSSSLHGLVVADSVGVPNRWMRLSDRVIGGGYKFVDHFRCVGQADEAPIEPTAPEAIRPHLIDDVANAYRRPDLDLIKHRLMASFPTL